MINQLTKCMLHICIAIDISFNSINDTIVCHTTLNDVVTIPRLLSFSAAYQRMLNNDI